MQTAAFEQRRRETRLPAYAPVFFRTSRSKKSTAGILDNVSPGGCFIRTHTTPRPGSTARLQFKTFSQSDALDVACRVAHTQKGIGLQFIEMNEPAKQWLNEYCADFHERDR